MRRTWDYHPYKRKDAPLPLLMHSFDHSPKAQTLAYLFVREREARDLFLKLDL